MKLLAVVVCALLVSYSQAGVIDELKASLSGVGDIFKNVGSHVAENGKVVLTQMLEQAKQAGNQLLQSAIVKLLENLGTQVPGKRDLGMLEKLMESKQFLHEHFENAKQQVSEVLEKSVDKLHEVAEKIFNLKYLENQTPEEVIQEVEQAIQHQSSVTRGFVENVFAELLSKIRPVPSKRFLREQFQKLVDFFTPHVQAITKVFTDLGNTLKGHVTNVGSFIRKNYGELKLAMNTVATELKGKLAGHVTELKKHGENLVGYGKDAYQALLTAVTDILKQTATNAAQTGKEAVSQTITNMAQTITNQLVEMIAQGKAGN